MRYILGAIAAAAIAGVAFVQPAEARCFWNGFETVCVHHNYPMWGQAVWKRPEISVLAIPPWANLL